VKVKRLVPEGLLLFELDCFKDHRGIFFEMMRTSWIEQYIGKVSFVQDNISISRKNVVRGLHFQEPPHEQGKLITCLSGKIIDVAVDLRKKSPYYGKFLMIEMSSEVPSCLWIPPGFAHGFLALEDNTIVHYKCTAYYNKESERCIIWNDPTLGIPWMVSNPLLSDKDKNGIYFDEYKSPF